MAGDVVRGARERQSAYSQCRRRSPAAGAERSPVVEAGSVAFRPISRDKRQDLHQKVENPLVQVLEPTPPAPRSVPRSQGSQLELARFYIAGLSWRCRPSTRWRHAHILGLDQVSTDYELEQRMRSSKPASRSPSPTATPGQGRACDPARGRAPPALARGHGARPLPRS